MAKDPLDELVEFLKPDVRLDLKHISLDHLVGISGTENGIQLLLSKDSLIQSVIDLSDDKVEEIAKNALLLLVNVSANARGAEKLVGYRHMSYKNFVEQFVGYILNPNKHHADAACMILSNVTRVEENLEKCVDLILPHLNDILNAFVNEDYNKKGSNLHYISPLFSNLSCSPRIRKWLTEKQPFVPLMKLLPFCNYAKSNIRRGGAIGTLRNLSFDSNYHSLLIDSDYNILVYLLMPLMGNEDYADEEMDALPISLQYLPQEKVRDPDVDIRKMIIETLNRLCSKPQGRMFLRDNGVYYVLREYHKWEKNPAACLACENVVDILIQKEDEVGAEDLSTVEIPKELLEKFKKMDDEYINN